jgi:hypothetical protein
VPDDAAAGQLGAFLRVVRGCSNPLPAIRMELAEGREGRTDGAGRTQLVPRGEGGHGGKAISRIRVRGLA